MRKWFLLHFNINSPRIGTKIPSTQGTPLIIPGIFHQALLNSTALLSCSEPPCLSCWAALSCQPALWRPNESASPVVAQRNPSSEPPTRRPLWFGVLTQQEIRICRAAGCLYPTDGGRDLIVERQKTQKTISQTIFHCNSSSTKINFVPIPIFIQLWLLCYRGRCKHQ